MTTQELKQQIDKVLGNSIRCLLPSYWWKRLFHQVADKIDEVEQSTSKLIDSKVEEVKMPIVESESELYELKIEEGSLAAVVGGGPRKFSECFQANYDELVFPLSDNRLARIQGIGVNYVNNVTDDFIVSILNKTNTKKIWLSVSKDLVGAADISTGQEFIFYRSSDSAVIQEALDVFNAYLKEDEFYYIATSFSSNMGNTSLEIVDNYFSIQATSDLYIKGASWEMLTKENVVNSEDELDGLGVSYGSIAKVNSKKYGKINPYNCYRITSMSSSDIVKTNWYKLKRITQIDVINPDAEPSIMPTICLHGYANLGRNLIQISYYDGYKVGTGNSSSTTLMSFDELNSLLKNSDYRLLWISDTAEHREFFDKYVSLYSPDLIAPNAYIKGDSWTRLLKEGDVTGGGADITIDSELSDTSENPVQNKVITAELDYFAEQVADAINSKADASAVETINTRLSELLPTVADKTYVDSAISAAITNTLNTEV